MSRVEEKAELERLLNSQKFSEAEQLRKLLRVLCEPKWASGKVGNLEPLTQYDIAAELYGDVQETSNVRITINRLRERLAAYYGTEGAGSSLRLEIPRGSYSVHFEPVAKNALPAEQQRDFEQPVKAGWRGYVFTTRYWIPASIVLAIVFTIALALSQTNWFIKERNSAISIAPSKDGHQVVGFTETGEVAWVINMPGLVRHTKVFDENASHRNTFVVLCGGRDGDITDVLPRVIFVTTEGEWEEIGLFENFDNPFRNQFSEEHFLIQSPHVCDLNRDGFMDLIVECRHTLYPDILFFISGATRKVIGSFANSGHVQSYKIMPGSNPLGGNYSSIGILATNNVMGELGVLCLTTSSMHAVSPDHESSVYCGSYRPLTDAGNNEMTIEPVNEKTLKLVGGSKPVEISANGALNLDIKLGKGTPVRAKAMWTMRGIYAQIRRARREVMGGNLKQGLEKYEQCLEDAEHWGDSGDPALRFYIELDLVRSLKSQGLASEALARLPSINNSPNPYRVYQLKGRLQLLQKDYAGAKDSFKATGKSYTSYEGFVLASILCGDDSLKLHKEIGQSFSFFAEYPVTHAWELIPRILDGDVEHVTNKWKQSQGVASDETLLSDKTLFPEEARIWEAFAAITRDGTFECLSEMDNEPVQADPLIKMKKTLLAAYGLYMTKGADAALPELKSSYREFREEIVNNERALIPFVLAAYCYGFATLESSDVVEDEKYAATVALQNAYEYFKHGARAERASKILLNSETWLVQ